MNTKAVPLYYSVCVYLLMFQAVSAATCEPNSFDVEGLIKRGVALVGAVFWKGKIQDLTQCATACIRRKVCKSFNFDTWAGMCELNVAVEGEHPFRHGLNELMYSDIEGWLSEFDPSCASRPCTANQACIPGELGNNVGSAGNCSYICIEMTLLCPKLYSGFSGGRKVGDIAIHKCGIGEVGGGSAECLVTQEWNETVNCAPLYGYACTVDGDCRDIDGVCTTGTCQCSSEMIYEPIPKRCNLACKSSPSYDKAMVGTETGTQRSFTCDAKYRPTVPLVECVVDPGTQTGSWSPDSGICAELYGYVCTADADCSELGGMCDSVCTCAKNKVYDVVEKSCITRFKLLPGDGGDGVKTGQLYMHNGSDWANVCHDGWTWTATRAICQDINPNFSYGGTFHKKAVYGEGDSPNMSIKLKGLDCGSDGSATSFVDCTTDATEYCNHNNDLGLTCYDSDITDQIRLTNEYGVGLEGQLRLEVKYGDVWGTVCGKHWDDLASTVACKSIDTTEP